MLYDAFEFSYETFSLSQVDWERCPVISWEGFGWNDSIPSCSPENGDKENPEVHPITGWEYSHGCNELVSLVPGYLPEPGWTVVGIYEGEWVCIPPWYVYPPKKDPPRLVGKALTALAVGALALWGGINLLPQSTGVNQPQTTYQAK